MSLDLRVFANLKYLIYGYNYQQELYNSEDITQTKNNIEKSKDTKFIIYADFENLDQILNVIENLTSKPSQRFSIANYKCDCGHYVTIDTYNGSCPICGKESRYKRRFKTKCPVCEANCLKDQFGNGECENCGWKLDKFANKFKNRVIYPNLISLNKAKKLYSEGKPFEPDLEDFIEALFVYSEVQFKYKNIYYELILSSDENKEIIKMNDFNGGHLQTFETKEDFINNAKIDDKLLKDIWKETTERDWLQ